MRKNKTLFTALLLVGASVFGGVSTAVAIGAVNNSTRTTTVAGTGYPDFTSVAENTINSVVSIKNYAAARQQQQYYFGGDDDFWDFFGFPFGNGGQQRKRQQQQPQQQGDAKPQLRGSGSGVIISDDGYIVTNNHVVDGAEKLTVTLNDNTEFSARVIGTDPNTDIALIKISPKGKELHPIKFGDSDNVKVGEWCLAVGNPFGFNSSVTAGVISAKGRGVNESQNSPIKTFIQHDAAVNPGNSGGALVNTKGELIGINTMIYSQTGNYSGVSFAVPVNTVKKIVDDIEKYGSVQRAVLGITYQEMTADLAKEKGVTATSEGLYVAKVSDQSAAKQAGLQEGDVIVKLNNVPVNNGGEMQEQMNKLRPGDKATIAYYRNNKLRTTTVTFKNDQGSTKITKNSDFTSLGCAFTSLTDQEKEDLGLSHGVKVVSLKDGKFKREGIKDGFIITSINDEPVDSSDDVADAYNKVLRSSDTDKVMLIRGVYPTGKRGIYALSLADDEE